MILSNKRSTKLFISIYFISLLTICQLFFNSNSLAYSKSYPVIILSSYNKTMKIGDEYFINVFVSNGSPASFRSSSSKIASVDPSGLITAKSPGTCKITIKAQSSVAYCKITVSKTTLTLNNTFVSMENGDIFALRVKSSTNNPITYKSNRNSIATVDSNGVITACKPGDAIILVKTDNTTVTCRVSVKQPTITLNKTKLKMYRNKNFALIANISSGITPQWKSSKSSVVSVDENGVLTAKKHGIAIITVKADGVTKTCEVEVLSPTIKLSSNKLNLKVGETVALSAAVSSQNPPVWSSSRSSVANVSQSGSVTAKKAGTTQIKVTEDGTIAYCEVTVSK